MEGSFQERFERVQQRVNDACRRSGRAPEDIAILPVAKKFGPEAVIEAAASGVQVIGENRVQEARQKAPLCPSHLSWHMIGHLQRNKVRDAVQLFDMIHAVDSLPLLEALEDACAAAGKRMPVCLEVNVSGEGSKHGFNPEDVPAALEGCGRCLNLEVVGLMTIPPFAPEPGAARRHFAGLRDLRDRCRAQSGYELAQLSMGMSHDFEVAVEEGATWIRLGRDLFGERPKLQAPKQVREWHYED